MPTPVQVGTEIKEIDLLELLPPDEGELNMYYGMIGSGKTYTATVDVVKELNQGKIEYVSWKIDWQGYDERTSKLKLFWGVLGFKKDYRFYNKTNLHRVDIFNLENIEEDGVPTGKDFVTWLSEKTDCKIWLDEGHIAVDSYDKTKMEMAKRNIALLTRHLDRSIVLISQRPAQIHISFRAQVNRFFKLEKIGQSKLFGTVRFKRTEFQETDKDGMPDESKVKEYNEETHLMEDTDEYAYALSEKRYRGDKKVYALYDSKYRRAGMASSQKNYTQVFHMSWVERWKGLWHTNVNEKRSKVLSVEKKIIKMSNE